MDLHFQKDRPFGALLLGRIAIDFYPVEYPQPLDECQTFTRYIGGSPANIAVGLARLGEKVGFFARVSDDAFGTYAVKYFQNEGIDTSHIRRCENGENLGLAFTEILSETQSSLLMYRKDVADLQLNTADIDESYIAQCKLLLVSGTALSVSPSREAAFKAIALARLHGVKVVFDIDYRPQNWKNRDEIAAYYAAAAKQADILLGSREEFDLTEALERPGMNDRESAAYWFTQGAKLLVIKHGKAGSFAYSHTGDAYCVKPFHVKLLKGFGGGDGYAAALLYGLMNGLPLQDCLEMGSAEAAMLVASPACSACMPTLPELMQFIAQGRKKSGNVIEKL